MDFRYSEWNEERHGQHLPLFDQLFNLFQQLLEFAAGDAAEALRWLTQLDEKYGITTDDYGMGDFIEELKKRGFLEEDGPSGTIKITARTERTLRQRALEDLFSNLQKSGRGDHKTPHAGAGDERMPETRAWQFGDDVHNLDVTGTLSNAFRRSGTGEWNLREDDFEVVGEQIEAIPAWELATCFSPIERAVLAYTDALVLQDGRVPDVVYAGMLQYDGDLKLPERFLVAPPAIKGTLGEQLAGDR